MPVCAAESMKKGIEGDEMLQKFNGNNLIFDS
jgi:hypothetical protein